MAFKDRLGKAMDYRGVRQAQLARAVGVSRTAVHSWLSGKIQEISGDKLQKIANYLDVPAEYLLSGSPVPDWAENRTSEDAGQYSANALQDFEFFKKYYAQISPDARTAVMVILRELAKRNA